MLQNDLAKRVFRSFLWVAGARYVGQVLSWAVTIVIARILSPRDYGLMGMATLFYSFLIMFAEMGFGAAVIQKKDLTEGQLRSASWFLIASSLLLYLLSFLLAPLLALFFQEPQLVALIRVLALNFIIVAVYSVPYNLLARKLQFDRISKAEFIANLCGSAATLALAMNGFEFWSLVAGFFVINTVKAALVLYYQKWVPRFRLVLAEIREILGFGSKITGAHFLWYFYSNSDFLIAGRMLGKVALGAYSLAFQIASLPLDKIVSLVNQIAFPAYAEIQSDRASMQRYFLKTIRILSFIVFPVFTGLFLVAEDLVMLFLTAKWSAIIFPLKALLVVSILRTLSVLSPPVVNALNRPGISLFNTLLCAVVMPVSFLIGVRFGINGLAAAWLIAYPLVFTVMTWNSLRVIEVTPGEYARQIAPTALICLVMVAVVTAAQKHLLADSAALPRMTLTCLTGVAVFSVFSLLLNRPVMAEMISLVRRKGA
ncbi:MAG: hypothetical protein A2010_05255 [Nitrospirae bacterium GWD2_57_9]|nr:MAG: hypothetical protein A2010_05255 [Nitrospirae bacterium GWD2_57_9]